MPALLGIEAVSKPFWSYFNLQSRIPSEQNPHDTSNKHQLRLKKRTPSLYLKDFDKKDLQIAKRFPWMAVSPKIDVIFGMLRELGPWKNLQHHNNEHQEPKKSRKVALQTILNRWGVAIPEYIRGYNSNEIVPRTVGYAAIQCTWPQARTLCLKMGTYQMSLTSIAV